MEDKDVDKIKEEERMIKRLKLFEEFHPVEIQKTRDFLEENGYLDTDSPYY